MYVLIVFLYVLIGWIWQFPQTILGFIVSRFFKDIHIGPAGFKIVLVRSSKFPCMCLGEHLFVGNLNLFRFVYGRGIVSRKLGPLFFPLISFPSIALLMLGKSSWFMTFYGTRWSIKNGARIDR